MPPHLRSRAFRWLVGHARRAAALVSEHVGHFRALRLSVATIRLLHRSQGGPRSAEIAYYSILSTIPFGALMITALAYGAVDLLDSGWTVDELTDAVHDLLQSFVPSVGEEIDRAIRWLLEGRGTLGVIGSATLFFTASLVFGAISRATAAIFEVRARDRFSTTAIFALGLCALALLLITGIPGIVTSASVREAGVEASAAEHPILYQVVIDLGLLLCFSYLLWAVVRVRLRLLHVLCGAALFIVLFEVARFAFVAYLTHLSRLNLVYGSLAGVMAGIVWAYYAAATLLVSVCLVRVLHDRLWATPYGELLPSEPLE